jgi:hypothetical protein
MSILDCSLAIEKESDGKPFTVCSVGTWFYVGVSMARKDMSKEKFVSECERIYNSFGTGEDKSERGATLKELKVLDSNGGIDIIPKTKNNFIPVEKWTGKV